MQGILFIAFGDRYKIEADRALKSLRIVSPDIPVAVITDKSWKSPYGINHFILRDNTESFLCKPLYVSDTPFEETLFVDTDVIFSQDITPVFGLLKYYDVGVRFDGPQLNEPDGLALHTQCNSGVILYRNNNDVKEMFSIWKDLYRAEIKKTNATDLRGLGDQRYLSIAIAKSKARSVHLATYLNFAIFETIITYSPPFIYHGRRPEMEMLHSVISRNWDNVCDYHPRLWLPNIKGLLPAGVRRSDPLLAAALILRRTYNSVRWILKKLK